MLVSNLKKMSNSLNQFKMEFKEELINEIISRDFSNNSDDLWVIMIEDKIFCPVGAGMFHVTQQQAWRHFYNEYHWRIKSAYKIDKYGDNYWKIRNTITETDTQIWNAFKSELYQNYNFRIIQWKDAKRDVCSESRD